MNLDDATMLVTTAGVLYPSWWLKLDRRTQDATFAAWASMLEDIELAPALAALKRHAATNKWPPSVAEIRAIVAEATVGRRRSGVDAWGDVKAAISRDGRYRTPRFADPLAARAVEAIGWVAICDSEDEMVERAHFARAYDALAVGAAEDATVATLPGVSRPALPGASPAAALVGDVARRLTGGAS